jgi:Leucine-rich repeat (LRR) protein
MQNITVLDVTRSTLADQHIPPIGRLYELHSLYLTGNPSITTLSPIASCQKLRRLIAGECGINDEGIALLHSLHLLEELDLHVSEISDLTLLVPLLHHHRLTTLNVFQTAVRNRRQLQAFLAAGVSVVSELFQLHGVDED